MGSMFWRRRVAAPAVVFLSVVGGASAVALTTASSSASGVTPVTTESAFRTAWANDATVTLGANITLTCFEKSLPGASEAVRNDVSGPGTLDGAGFTITQTCPNTRVLQIAGTTGDMTIENVTITGGRAVFDTFSGNGGGGIQNTSEGSLTVISSTFTDNHTCEGGGGIENDSETPLTVISSTFTNNAADYGGAFTPYNATATVTNSTVTGNTAASGAGGIEAEGDLNLAYSTVVGNTMNPSLTLPECASALGAKTNDAHAHLHKAAPAGDPANIDTGDSDGTFTSFGNIVANPIGGANCQVWDQHTSQGYNWSDDTSCMFDNATDKAATGNDPKLNPLGSWGGPTQTMLPLTPRYGGVTSPVIDAIPLAACKTGIAAGVTTDQRGIVRPQLVGCDIGAVEVTQDDLQVKAAEVVLPPKFTG
jgi:hypothetical protein